MYKCKNGKTVWDKKPSVENSSIVYFGTHLRNIMFSGQHKARTKRKLFYRASCRIVVFLCVLYSSRSSKRRNLSELSTVIFGFLLNVWFPTYMGNVGMTVCYNSAWNYAFLFRAKQYPFYYGILMHALKPVILCFLYFYDTYHFKTYLNKAQFYILKA